MNKTLLCHWYGEPLYEEDAPREKLVEVIKYFAAQAEREREQREKDRIALDPI